MAALAGSARRFYVHACDEGRSHAHLAPGAARLQDTALRFVEHWTSSSGEVKVIAAHSETEAERCFIVDLHEGAASACP
jgi:hypothetical protein